MVHGLSRRLSAGEIGPCQALQLAPFLLFTASGGSVTDRIGARTSFAAATRWFALALAFFGLVEPEIGFHGPRFAGCCLLSSAMPGLLVIPSFYVARPLMLRTWFPDRCGLIGVTGVAVWGAAILLTTGAMLTALLALALRGRLWVIGRAG